MATATKKAARPASKPAAKKPASKPAAKKAPEPLVDQAHPEDSDTRENFKHSDDTFCHVDVKGTYDRDGMIGLAKRMQRAAAELF